MAIPHSLEHSAEAGLPATFWQGVSVTEEPGHVQVLSMEQAQSSRWSLSTSGTPHESIFPANAKNLSRTLSSPRAKSLYDSDPRRKRMFLVKHPNRREDSILTSAKFEALKPQGLTVTIGLKEGINTDTSDKPIYITPVPSSTERSVSSTDHNRRWKKRKNSLSKLVNYPTKILGMILPRRSDNPKQSPSVIPPIPPKIVLPSPSLPLRRAETTIRRPKRSCELQVPDQSTRWSMASTRAIRGERFSQSLDLRRNPIDPPETERSLPPSPPPKGAYHPPPPPFPLPPLPALTRSKTQPAKLRPEPTKPVSAKSPSPRTHIRNQSERRSPRSGGPSLTLLRPGLASDSHLPISQGKEKEMGLETVASIANRIAARELQEHMHDSWDFLDYYAQSSGRGEKL